MTPPINNNTLFLSSEGDSIEIKKFKEDDKFLPEQAQAQTCKTHKQVLAFLEELKNSDAHKQLNFYHIHNTSYDDHLGTWPKGVAHPCSLEKQINFVRYKISEQLLK